MEKPQMSDQHIIDEITAVCNSLGKLDVNDGTYMKDRDCKACLREVMRYLNADTNRHVARCALGAINVIKSDLIPLIVQYCDFNDGDPELFTTILRLAANLTSSIHLLDSIFGKKEDKNELDDMKLRNKLMKSLYGYKEAFAEDENIWKALNIHLRHNLEDEITFERLIILIRNILHIPVDSTGDLGVHSDFDAHEMCLYRMDKSGMLNTIIKIASESQRGTEFCFHIMEVIYLMLRDQNPLTIALSKPYASKQKLDDDDPDRKRLAELSARARIEREISRRGLPYNTFSKRSSFIVQNCRSLGNAPLIVREPPPRRDMIKFDSGKMDVRKVKNRKPLTSENSIMFSDSNTKGSKVTYSLKVFCKHFVEKIYSNYMQQIKHNLIQKKTQENDESYYLWAVQFFTSFCRNLKLNIDHISETLSTSTLHFIQILITNYQDKLKLEKKEFRDTSQRLHLALRAYREILYLIKYIEPGSPFVNTIEAIQRNIFTETEYSVLLLNLFQQYNEPKHSSNYLTDLIQANHVFTELLENYSRSHAAVIVDEREPAEPEEPLIPQENQTIPEQIAAKDLESDDISQQPEANQDKSTPLNLDILGDGAQAEDVSKKKAKKKQKKKMKDVEFRTAHFMSRYCCPGVIEAHLRVLRNFKTNDDLTNAAILKFFERIVYDCKNDVILFQASIFRCLLDIMDYHTSLPGHERFVTLGKRLIESFGAMANKKRWMFQELLFWKTCNDVIEIENAINPPPVVDADDIVAETDRPALLRQMLDSIDEQKPTTDSIADLMAELDGVSSDEEPPNDPLPSWEDPASGELESEHDEAISLDAPLPSVDADLDFLNGLSDDDDSNSEPVASKRPDHDVMDIPSANLPQTDDAGL